MYRLKLLIISIFVTVALFSVSYVTFAQQPVSTDTLFGGSTGQTAEELAAQAGLGISDPREIIARVINITLGFLGIIALGLIVYAGYMWMSAQGNDEQIVKAKKILIGGVIGLVIILSAFGIAAFVLRALGGATGTTGSGQVCTTEGEVRSNCNACGGSQTCTSGFWSACTPACLTDPTSSDFYIKRSYPNNSITVPVPRNAVVTLTFNQAVQASSVIANDTFNDTFKVEYLDESDVASAVDGTSAVSGRIIEFSPAALCPDNNQPGCFDQTDSKDRDRVRVSVSGGDFGVSGAAVLSVNNLTLSCSLSQQYGNPCVFDFEVGDYIDRQAPQVTALAFTDQQICVASTKTVRVEATDDSFIRLMEFEVRGGNQSLIIDADIASEDRNGTTYWVGTADIDVAALGNPASLNVRAIVTDADSNTAERAITADIRPAQCCNLTQDNNEAGLDCGGASGCLSCGELGPVIDWVSPVDDDGTPNGAPGNLVTIGGRYFGVYNATASKVYFSCLDGDSDSGCQTMSDGVWKEAKLAGSVNTQCSNTWTVRSIVAVVPGRESEISGVATGPIKIVRADNVFDTTNNAIGAGIANFEVNDIVRPGLCKIDDRQTPATPADKVPHREPLGNITLHGIQLGAGTFDNIKFGTTNINSVAVSGWSDKKIDSVTVPVLARQLTTVAIEKNNQRSNSLYIQIDESQNAPYITDITPRVGHIGDYITIRGGNFGSERGTGGKVTIGGQDALFVFASQCLDSVWKDSQIVAQIPATLGSGTHDITVTAGGLSDTFAAGFRLGDYCEGNVQKECGLEDGDEQCIDIEGACITTALPGLCKIVPDNGKIGTPVTFYGERFDSPAGKVRFYNNVDATPTNWSSELVNASVPAAAVSGDVRVVATGDLQSNPMDFRVGSCLDSGAAGPSNPACGAGGVCCAQNTQLPGSCVAEQAECGSVLGSTYSQYYVEFSTAVSGGSNDPNFTAPSVIEECNRSLDSCNERELPSPSPLTPLDARTAGKTWTDDGTSLACVNAVITARFTKLIDRATLVASGEGKTIVVKQCQTAASVDAPTNCGTDVIFDEQALKVVNADSQTAFILTPETLTQNTWYEVTLTTGIKSIPREGGLPLAASYSWKFKTKNDDTPCGLSCLSVNPATYTATRQNQKVGYVALPQQEDNACVMLNGAQFAYDWSSSNTTQASIPSNGTANTNTATALAETEPQQPVVITAKTSIGSNQYEGTGKLHIKFSDFYVLDEYPTNQCAEVCTNAEAGARLSAAIKPDITPPSGAPTINANKVKLDSCAAGSTKNNCVLPTTAVTPATTIAPYLVATSRQNVYDGLRFGLGGALLTPNTWYQATIIGGVNGLKSIDGKELVASESKEALGAPGYVWMFQTGFRACEADTVNLRPSPAISTVVDQRLPHSAEPVSNQQQCQENTPTILRTNQYNWQWSVDNTRVAAMQNPLNTYTRSAGTPLQANSPRQAVVTAGEGSIARLPNTCNLNEYGFAAGTPGQQTQTSAGIDSSDPSFELQSKPVSGNADFCLVCGNTRDDQCGVIGDDGALTSNPQSYGVGNTSCCYQRPQVYSPDPADGANNICRNSALEFAFDQEMDLKTVDTNVIIAANYETGSCPSGTEYLLLADNNSAVQGGFFRIVQETYSIVKNWFDSHIIFTPLRWAGSKIAAMPAVHNFLTTNAAWAIDYSSRWCAVKGTIESKNSNGKAEITFYPSKLFKAGSKHVILIKGDNDITDDVAAGVKNLNGVGLRGKDEGEKDSSGNQIYCDEKDNCTFNGQSFYGEVIDFTTLSTSAPNQGICVADRVEMAPAAWVFRSNQNDTRDDDTSNPSNYDKIHTDNDKEFSALMKSATGQTLAPVAEYTWDWEWVSKNSDLVSADELISDASKAMAKTTSDKTGSTYIDAVAAVTSSIAGVDGGQKIGKAKANVFLCQNPWPAFDVNNPTDWPFRDNEYNFETYYCRDKGGAGFGDDLPVMSGVRLGTPDKATTTQTILREYLFTNADVLAPPTGVQVKQGVIDGLGDVYPVDNPDGILGDRDVDTLLSLAADWVLDRDISNEVFKRADIDDNQEITAADVNLLVDLVFSPNNVILFWDAVSGAQSYNIYKSSSQGSFSSPFKQVQSTNVCENKQCSLALEDLVNGQTYYFAVASVSSENIYNSSAQSAEKQSVLSEEISITPERVGALSEVINFSASFDDKTNKVLLSWRPSPEEDVKGYEVSHGVGLSGQSALDEVRSVNGRNASSYEWTLSQEQVNNMNFFQVRAIVDKSASSGGSSAVIRISPKPLGAWRFDAKTKTMANDSPYNIPSQFVGGRGGWPVEGNFYTFTGKENYIRTAGKKDYLRLDIATGFSHEIWLRPRLDEQTDMGKDIAVFGNQTLNSVSYRYPSVYLHQISKVMAGFGTGSHGAWCYIITDDASTLPNNEWNFLGVIYDKIQGRYFVYVNGKNINVDGYEPKTDTGDSCRTYYPTPDVIYVKIGRVSDDSEKTAELKTYFKGDIAGVKLYDYARTESQILSEFNAKKSEFGL